MEEQGLRLISGLSSSWNAGVLKNSHAQENPDGNDT